MNPETIKKEFEENFVGKMFFPDSGEETDSMISWFLSKLSQAQAEAREEVIEEVYSWLKYDVYDAPTEATLEAFRSKFPPQTN